MKRIVIIGGGFAGAAVACKLQHQYDVTLLDTKDFFEFTPGILYTIVHPGHAGKVQVKHTHYLKKGRFIQGEATKIKEKEVIVGQQRVPFDYLVLCGGSHYASPIKQENLVLTARASALQQQAEKLQKSKEALIIGGGLVGIELAAEIAVAYPKIRITMVQDSPQLAPRMNERARQYAEDFLRKHKVELMLGEKIISASKGRYKTDKGRTLKAEMAFLCTGIYPNSEFLPFALTEQKYVNVNQYLQVEGHPAVFAAGDITAIAEEKTAQNAEEQAKIVIQNIHNMEQHTPLVPYQSKERMMVVSLGPRQGILTYKKWAWKGFIPGLLKHAIEWKTMQRYR